MIILRFYKATLFTTVFSIISLLSFGQNFVNVSGITTEINYTTVDEAHGVSLMGGNENYISTNQGLTWVAFDNSAGTVLENFIGLDAAIINNTTYCMIGKNNSNNTYSVARTSDGGTTWTLYNTVSSFIQEFSAIQANGNYLILAAKNGIYHSSNGGVSWTFVTLSSGGEVSNFVDFNTASSTWFVGSYTSDLLLSIDQGLTWNVMGGGINSNNVVNSSNLNNQLLLTQETFSGSRLLTIDGSNTVSDIVNIPQGLLQSWPPLNAANYLPSGDIIACNNDMFYRIDTSNWAVYHIDYPSTSGNAETHIALGTTYGIASKWWNPGSIQSAYRLDYTTPPSEYVASAFYIVNEENTCAGDNIVAVAYSDYADSLQWYIGGNYLGGNASISYPTPNTPGSYTFTLNVFYNGVMKTSDYTITFYAPQAPHTFVYQTDTIACYDQPHLVFINPNSGIPQNTAVKILYDGQLVAGPQTMTSGNMYLYTTPITTQDTMMIISYNTLHCDSSADTIVIPMTLGPNMLDFNVLSSDSSICIGADAGLSLENTHTQYLYDFSTTFSTLYGIPLSTQLSGNSPDTLDVLLSGLPIWTNQNTAPETYTPYTYMYTSINVTDPLTGCVSLDVEDTVRIYRPSAYFELHSNSFFKNDTVQLSNAFVTDNRLWSSTQLASNFIMNPADTIPLIIPDTVGFFEIQLRNEPILGCVDSMIRTVHIADPTVNLPSACNNATSGHSAHIFKTNIDQFGNRYELGINGVGPFSWAPGYTIRKFDLNGIMIWEKVCSYTGWPSYHISGLVIEDIEFDCDGNLICAAWIGGEDSHTDDYFNFTPPFSTWQQWCLVLKIDKTDGSLIWSSRLNEMIGIGLNPSPHWKITDLVVDKERGLIHTATYRNWDLDLITLDMDGNYVNSAGLDMGGWSQQAFIPPSFHLYSGLGSAPNQSYWSPQLELLSTGVVVGVGNYKNVNIPALPQLNLGTAQTGMFIMKYSPNQGIYDVDRLAQLGTNDWSYFDSKHPHFAIDKNDNITVVGDIQNGNLEGSFEILDSTITMKSGTFILSIDTNYNMNWITRGTFAQPVDFEIAKTTGDYFLSLIGKDNISFGNQNTHLMAGYDVPQDIQYTQYPNSQNDIPWVDYYLNDLFLVKLDSLGNPLEMKFFEDTASSSASLRVTPTMAVSPCGEIAYTLNRRTNLSSAALIIDGQLVQIDSVLTLKFSDDCVNSCSYINITDDLLNTCTTDSVTVQFCDFYNVDTVYFDLYLDGNLQSSGINVPVTEGTFNVELISSGTYTLAFSSPSTDTLTIINTIITPSSYQFNDSLCYGEIVTIQASNNTYTYNWLNGTLSGDVISLDSNDYSIGINQIDLIIYDGVCSMNDTVSFFIDGCLSVEEKEIISYSVFPNPNTGTFVVTTSQFLPGAKLELTDILGVLIEQRSFNNSNQLEFATNLPSGTYLINIRYQGSLSVERVLVR